MVVRYNGFSQCESPALTAWKKENLLKRQRYLEALEDRRKWERNLAAKALPCILAIVFAMWSLIAKKWERVSLPRLSQVALAAETPTSSFTHRGCTINPYTRVYQYGQIYLYAQNKNLCAWKNEDGETFLVTRTIDVVQLNRSYLREQHMGDNTFYPCRGYKGKLTRTQGRIGQTAEGLVFFEACGKVLAYGEKYVEKNSPLVRWYQSHLTLILAAKTSPLPRFLR